MKLIINADDFGLSESVNQGILHGIKEGVITSASLMMNMPATNDAIRLIKNNQLKNIGIHLNITVGKPLRKDVGSLVDGNGNFHYRDKIGSLAAYEDVKKEMAAQIDKFISAGFYPDHLNCHHDIYKHEHIVKAKNELAIKYNLPARTETKELQKVARELGIKTTDIFIRDFFGKKASEATLNLLISKYSKFDYTCEIMTHVGFVDERTIKITSYNKEREVELNILQLGKKAGLFNGIKLISFSEL